MQGVDVRSYAQKVIDKVFPLPSPRELGRSKDNALPMDWLDDLRLDDARDPSRYSWEDWEVEMKRDHPVSWFVRREIPRPFKRAWDRIDDAIYWVKCHTLPSYRFHILDLRNPGGGIEWDHGWRDRTEVLLWACFKILVDFVELEKPYDMEQEVDGLTPEQIEEQGLTTQLKKHREMMDLYRWWKTGRAEDEERISALYTARDADYATKAERRAALDAWSKARDEFEERDQTNLLRLIAIRRYLWT